MNSLELIGVASFVAAALVAALRAIRWRAASKSLWSLLYYAAAAALGVLLVTGYERKAPIVAVIVLDQPLVWGDSQQRRDLQTEIDRLRCANAVRLTLVVCAPGATAAAGGWIEVEKDDDRVAHHLLARAGSAANPNEALDLALARIAEESTSWWHVSLGRRGRVVVGVSDRERWKTWQPVEIDALLAKARRHEVEVDVVDMRPRPMTPTLEISVPSGIPAVKPLNDTAVVARVTCRVPSMAALAGSSAAVIITGQLDHDVALLTQYSTSTTVSTSGAIEFDLPLRLFRGPTPGQPVHLTAGFVLCELKVQTHVAGRQFSFEGAQYLPVRWTKIAFVVGEGANPGRLNRPRLIAPDPASATVSELDRLKAMAEPALKMPRSGPLAYFDIISEDDFFDDVIHDRPLPFSAILHEPSPALWTMEFSEKLLAAVQGGMHLMIIDPPSLPDQPDVRATLERLLPALAAKDARWSTPRLRTVDRTPVLSFVFDYGRWTTFTKSPNGTSGHTSMPISDGLKVQYEFAKALVGRYRDLGLILGQLKFDATSRVIVYAPDPKDRIYVRCAAKLSAAPNHPLEDLILPSALLLRLASLFPTGTHGIDLDKTGLRDVSVRADLRELLDDDPVWTPNHAIVSFVGNVPQPTAGAVLNPAGGPKLVYTLAGDARIREFQETPDGMLAQLLMRGVTCAVVRLDFGDPDPHGYEQGFMQMTRPNQWPHAGHSPFLQFQSSTQNVVERALQHDLAALESRNVFLLTAGQAKERLLTEGTSPLYARLNLASRRVTDDAVNYGKSLADLLQRQHRSPVSGMACAAALYGRAVDERIGPGQPVTELESWQSSDTSLNANWPETERWSAPRRFRLLQPSTSIPQHAQACYVYAVDTGVSKQRLAPLPLAIGATCGDGEVVCLAYSPFETSEPWWQGRECIFDPVRAMSHADQYGVQRIQDFAYLCSRLNPLPGDQPIVRELHLEDARGGLLVTAEFSQSETLGNGFYQPRLWAASGAGAPSVPLRQTEIQWHRGEVRYRLAPEATAQLFAAQQAVADVELEFLPGRARATRFKLPRPTGSHWRELSSEQSVMALAEYTGGAAVSTSEDLPAAMRDLRLWGLLGLTILVALMCVVRAKWRLRRWLRIARADRLGELEIGDTFGAAGLTEEIAKEAASPSDREVRGLREFRDYIRPGSHPQNITDQSLLKIAYGVPGPPQVDHRTTTRASEVTLIVPGSGSLRLFREKALLAAICARFLAQVSWARRASVSLCLPDAQGHWQRHGPFHPGDEESLWEVLTARSGRMDASRPGFLSDLEATPGSVVIWLSDFVDEDCTALLDWGLETTTEYGKFAGVHVMSPREFDRVGWGFTRRPWAVLDRTACTRDDLRRQGEAHVEFLKSTFTFHFASFASVHAGMSENAIIAELVQAGIVDLAAKG